MYPANYRTGDEDDCPCTNGQSAPSASCPYHPCDPTVGIADVQDEPYVFDVYLDDWSRVMDLPAEPTKKPARTKKVKNMSKEPRKARRIKVIPPKSPERLTVLDIHPGETFRYKLYNDLKNVYMLLEPQSATEARYVHLNTGRVYKQLVGSQYAAKAIELVDVTMEVTIAPYSGA